MTDMVYCLGSASLLTFHGSSERGAEGVHAQGSGAPGAWPQSVKRANSRRAGGGGNGCLLYTSPSPRD
eukprot:7851991-Alexandrium_andersonii.AAC.1